MMVRLGWIVLVVVALVFGACGDSDEEGGAGGSVATTAGGGGGGGGGAASAAEIRAYGEALCNLNCVVEAECDDAVDGPACLSACEAGLDGPQPGLPQNPSASCVALATSWVNCQIELGCDDDIERCDDEERAYSQGCR